MSKYDSCTVVLCFEGCFARSVVVLGHEFLSTRSVLFDCMVGVADTLVAGQGCADLGISRMSLLNCISKLLRLFTSAGFRN